jgi:class I fructose-bisphosphate aldolase
MYKYISLYTYPMTNVINRRLRRLTDKKGRFLLVPMDHGLTNGPLDGIVDIREAVEKLVGSGVTGFILHKGAARHVIDILEDESLIMHLSAGNALSPYQNRKRIITSVEEAISLGADAVSVHVNVGNEDDSDMLYDFGEVVSEAHSLGIPVLAMMYARGDKITNQFDAENIAMIARVADEVGADIVKVYYTGDEESFKKVVKGVRIPVVIAGGPKIDSEDKFLQMVRGALRSGAAGISIGRNIWQSSDPRGTFQRISAIMEEVLNENYHN